MNLPKFYPYLDLEDEISEKLKDIYKQLIETVIPMIEIPECVVDAFISLENRDYEPSEDGEPTEFFRSWLLTKFLWESWEMFKYGYIHIEDIDFKYFDETSEDDRKNFTILEEWFLDLCYEIDLNHPWINTISRPGKYAGDDVVASWYRNWRNEKN